MQKIVIKNFGAIKEAEIDIPKTLVLIGEQASGKSTIAKLIYFFQDINDDIFETFISSKQTLNLVELITDKFYNFFGNDFQNSLFELKYYTNIEKNKFIKISNINKEPKVEISEKFIEQGYLNIFNFSKKRIKEINDKLELTNDSNESFALELYKRDYLKVAQRKLTGIFNLQFESNLFVVAGRNSTVQYNDLFEKYLFAEVKNRIDDNKKQKSLELKEQTIDELLTMKFMERVSRVKTIFERNGGTFASLLKSENKNGIFQKAENKISEILKGKYSSDKLGERINLDNGSFVRLSNASSGQQESIRILQDLFLVILQNQKVLRIIEEPEAHLFPIAQKQMIELLALMVNKNEDSRLIITTHSPYILSTFNNLLFASRVVEKNPDAENAVSEVVDIDFRLKASDFAAYTLRFTEGGFVSESIMSDKGVIKQNYLDTVSDMLSYEFNHLMTIHAKTFARK